MLKIYLLNRAHKRWALLLQFWKLLKQTIMILHTRFDLLLGESPIEFNRA